MRIAASDEFQEQVDDDKNEFRINLAWETMAQYLSRKRKGRTSINSVPPFLRFVSVTPFDVDNLRSALICHYSSSILSRKQTKYSGKQSKEIDPILSA
jgi:hypothetical protein